MSNYQDESSVDFLLNSGEWHVKEATQLIEEYKACRTEHARKRLLPKLEHMGKRLGFEKQEIGKLMDEHGV